MFQALLRLDNPFKEIKVYSKEKRREIQEGAAFVLSGRSNNADPATLRLMHSSVYGVQGEAQVSSGIEVL